MTRAVRRTTRGWPTTRPAAATRPPWRATLRSPPTGPRGSARTARQPSSSSWRCAITSGPDLARAALLQRLSYECYLTDQLIRARDSVLAALGHLRAGAGRAPRRHVAALAVAAVLGPGAERGQRTIRRRRGADAGVPRSPARNWPWPTATSLSCACWPASPVPPCAWAPGRSRLARKLGDRETEIHALNNVGTAQAAAGGTPEGWARLTQSLDLALAADAHEHAARAFTNLGSTHVLNCVADRGNRHLEAGITYCADRDLDTWRGYMTAWLARSLASQGQYAAAERHLPTSCGTRTCRRSPR